MSSGQEKPQSLAIDVLHLLHPQRPPERPINLSIPPSTQRNHGMHSPRAHSGSFENVTTRIHRSPSEDRPFLRKTNVRPHQEQGEILGQSSLRLNRLTHPIQLELKAGPLVPRRPASPATYTPSYGPLSELALWSCWSHSRQQQVRTPPSLSLRLQTQWLLRSHPGISS